MYGFEILHKCIKGVQTKNQKVLAANSYVCRSYIWKTGWELPSILNMNKVKRPQEARVKQFLFQNVQNNEIFEITKIFKISHWINVP